MRFEIENEVVKRCHNNKQLEPHQIHNKNKSMYKRNPNTLTF